MMATTTDTTRMFIEAARLGVRRTEAEIDQLQRTLSASRHVLDASRKLLKRIREHQTDSRSGYYSPKDPATDGVSALDGDVAREVFKKLVVEIHLPDDQRRELAKGLVRELTGCEQIEPALVDWIVHK
ncbi:hypothetical protein NKH55_13585 [Mesorhizobium opportunistum]|uniref:hypothetical protein n=1 Tax=Mesorhizobium opportunistum TaxID=593909 RepID=UPI00333ACDA4